MTAQVSNGQRGGASLGTSDGDGFWPWARAHRLYCTGVVAVVVATLVGANWAGQTERTVAARSDAPVIIEAPAQAD